MKIPNTLKARQRAYGTANSLFHNVDPHYEERRMQRQVTAYVDWVERTGRQRLYVYPGNAGMTLHARYARCLDREIRRRPGLTCVVLEWSPEVTCEEVES